MPEMGNPVAGQMARSIIDSLSSRGQPPSAGGGPAGANPDAASQSLSSQMSELGGADPQNLAKTLEKIKRSIVDLIPQTAFRVPGVSKHLTPMLKAIDGAIKEAQQALATQKTVGSMPGMEQPQQQPIGLSAANPPAAMSAGPGMASGPSMPGMGGGGM